MGSKSKRKLNFDSKKMFVFSSITKIHYPNKVLENVSLHTFIKSNYEVFFLFVRGRCKSDKRLEFEHVGKEKFSVMSVHRAWSFTKPLQCVA